ncbi:bifunctional 4-hydroxy-2-oxoglutarate aldolase/2-dehydro-3-deoxy-phosphogluconate aldolase [Salipaludibacillus aurantiacus]|uniref:2-dehydro-3-deoxyphosphogluconate aldolase / (4S)-4-hydroxy-2-oxoglutarate aldolase n=1 Tax=Salipaludibacillus aurantiacus TaxID=1601833 RepID=A0A1H9UDS0_9BACI|nr:bifunctional 4-hydroxy-2-oxoglutarate aldolase/2-dehydro-3-deoxy-phosphogluconate aldolase [Salipaludibacillus aurantiacus]SES07314.1 2-dehydro-3-deoxyphosphogluconate aldolase / (4S)-4-hydroxy-2-oxoglutarate aldolase [Salipaludibacillus aurantiacus]
MQVLEQLKETPLVAVIRETSIENIVQIGSALSKGGIRNLEITAETPKVTALIEKVTDELGDEVIVGAGTVLDQETARATIMAGAQFIVSPTVNVETIRMTKRYGVVSVPGALTPTEILTAYENGADMVKIFPANTFGPDYLKSLKGPFPHIPLMVTGGINLENIADYSAKGGALLGIGSNLVNPKKLVEKEDYEALTKEAARYVQKVKGIQKL